MSIVFVFQVSNFRSFFSSDFFPIVSLFSVSFFVFPCGLFLLFAVVCHQSAVASRIGRSMAKSAEY